jgi:gliding motility-associated transport system ATP-binding protein
MGNAPSSAMIEAQGLSRYFGPFVAVQGLSFGVPEGEIVAFLGPNGAGKTTTMRMLTGYLAASEGWAAIGGLDIRRHRLEAARRLGYLPENGPLYQEMTPLELLRFFGEARGLDRKRLGERVETVSAQCALAPVLEKPIGKLSKGYRQRVGLAQALLHDPDVLIMDEPTAGLDPNQIRDFRRLIQELRAKRKTILISTHILQEVDAVADRVLFIHDGRLIFDGSPRELKADGSLEQRFHEMTAGPPVEATPASGAKEARAGSEAPPGAPAEPRADTAAGESPEGGR